LSCRHSGGQILWDTACSLQLGGVTTVLEPVGVYHDCSGEKLDGMLLVPWWWACLSVFWDFTFSDTLYTSDVCISASQLENSAESAKVKKYSSL